jgi:hypothetical protein
MRHPILFLAFLLSVLGGFSQHDNEAQAGHENPCFRGLKGLAGHWKGKYQWSNNPLAKGIMNAEYSLTGNGTAVVEDLSEDGRKMMTSVYHMDGSGVRMTHFCAAGNQPRLLADSANSNTLSIEFRMLDITNLSSPDAGHVYGLKMDFISGNRLNLTYKFISKGVKSEELIELTRQDSLTSN